MTPENVWLSPDAVGEAWAAAGAPGESSAGRWGGGGVAEQVVPTGSAVGELEREEVTSGPSCFHGHRAGQNQDDVHSLV